MRIKHVLGILALCVSLGPLAFSQQLPSAPAAQTGSINGTVTDTEDGAIPKATITVDGANPADHRTAVSNDSGFFELNDLPPGTYHVTVKAKDFGDWTSPDVTLKPGEDHDLPDIKLNIATEMTTVTALYSPAQIATQQVEFEEQQRIFGVIPNFYVVYDPNAVAMPAKLKFKLALRTSYDPVTIAGAGFIALIDQAAGQPTQAAGYKNYHGGMEGYGQRLAANYTDGFTDVMLGGAIFPALLHQDPRYFYNGHGTKMHRTLYALAAPFICKGDNGHWQANVSSMGGDLASAAISTTYYPQNDRGISVILGNALISTGGRMVDALAQEFVIRKLTPKAKNLPQP